MTAKSLSEKKKVTSAEYARLQVIRDRVQREKPSLSELMEENGQVAVTTLGEYLEIQQILFTLRQLRKQRRMTLAELSTRTGIDSATLSKLESGKYNNPTLGTINRVSSALGKRVQCILVDAETPIVGSATPRLGTARTKKRKVTR
jgi:DNA-binding Xre family transcriptional regulator